MDPVTIISGATVAFNALKKGFAIGKDLQDMSSQLTKWAGHMSDLGQAEKQVKNPPWWKTLGGSVEAEAMEIFAAKQKAESMRKELKDFISVYYGPSKWQEILEIEAQLRKQKREHEHRKIEVRQKIIEWSAGIKIFIICTGCLFGFVWLMTL